MKLQAPTRSVKPKERRIDNLSAEDRVRTMRAVRPFRTSPELQVEEELKRLRILHSLQGGLPGKPDFLIESLRMAIFIHGCFWHGHGCRGREPITNAAYWSKKISSNKRRDRRVRRQLNHLGWQVFVIWECRLRKRGVATVVDKVLRRGRSNVVSPGPGCQWGAARCNNEPTLT
jgi:DNA mismatch endonuclease (patch repair protein)